MINPYKNSEESMQGIATAEAAMRWAAVIFTSAGALIYGKSLALQYLPEGWSLTYPISIACGLIGAAVMAYLTDMLFGTLLQRVTYDLLAAKHPNVVKWQAKDYFSTMRTAEKSGYIIVLAMLLAFDIYTTVIIRSPVADQARTETTINVDSLKQAIETGNAAKIAALSTERKERERNAARIAKEVYSAEKALAGLAAKGNAWAAGKLRKQTDSKTLTDRKAAAALDGNIAQIRADGEAYLQAQLAAAMAHNGEVDAKNATNRAVMEGMYLAFTLIPKTLAIILRIMMVVIFLAYSRNFNPDITGDGIIDYTDVEAYHQGRKKAPSAFT